MHDRGIPVALPSFITKKSFPSKVDPAMETNLQSQNDLTIDFLSSRLAGSPCMMHNNCLFTTISCLIKTP